MNEKLSLPVLVLRDIVLFPGTTAPLFIGRKQSIEALAAAKQIGTGDYALFTAQKKPEIDEPKNNELFKIGVIGKIIQTVKLPNNSFKLLVEVEQRAGLEFLPNTKFPMADFKLLPDGAIGDLDDVEMLVSDILSKFNEYVKINRKINPDILTSIADQRNPTYVTNIISSHLTCSVLNKQELMEIVDIKKRAERLLTVLDTEIALIETELNLQTQVKKQIEIRRDKTISNGMSTKPSERLPKTLLETA